jgi:hypothetical protein
MKLFAIAAIVAVLSGCAVGNQHGYSTQMPDLAVSGSRAVAVATQDARPYVLAKDKAPNFVGLSRGGFGNPFDITTGSGRPLAEDFSLSIARSLEVRGFKSTVVNVGAPMSADETRALISRAAAERLALVTINEWKSDTFMNTALHYDVLLRVYDANGSQVAVNRLTGQDNLGGNAINPPAHAKVAVPAAYKKKLEELFGNEAVLNSLR